MKIDHSKNSIFDWLQDCLLEKWRYRRALAVPLAELPVLRLRVAAPVRVVEGNVEKEWRGNIAEELSDQQLDVGDIPA